MNRAQYEAMARGEDSHFWFAGKREYIRALCDQFRLGGSILDVGCGTGAATKLLARYGTVIAIDQSPIACALARKRGILIRRGSANSLPFARSAFDLVAFLDVLYHKNVTVEAALSEAHRVLKPGGMVLITDCAHPWLWSAHDEVMGARERFTKRALEAAIASAGFGIRRSSYIFASTFPFFVLTRLFMRWRKPATFVTMPPRLINEILIGLMRLEAALLPYFNLPFGSSVIIVAERR